MLRVGRAVQCPDEFALACEVRSGAELCGVVRIGEEVLEDAWGVESGCEDFGIRTWEGVMKPARRKGDRQMWRLMERWSPEVERRLVMKKIEMWCREKYGDAAWDGVPEKPWPLAPTRINGEVVEYVAVWDKAQQAWRWVRDE